jgi:hypothetical protein
LCLVQNVKTGNRRSMLSNKYVNLCYIRKKFLLKVRLKEMQTKSL